MSRRGWALSGIAALAAAGCAWLVPARQASGDASLLTLRLATESASGAENRSARTFIALARRGEATKILSADQWSAGSPSSSFDAGRFVFVSRPAATDPPRIVEMRIGGGGRRVVTRGHGAPSEPKYMPDGRILFSDVPALTNTTGAPRSLYSCAPDGSDTRRLTFDNEDDIAPRLLPDGRVLFGRGAIGEGADEVPVLMTIHPDGSGLAKYDGEISTERAPLIMGASTDTRRPDGYVVVGETILRPVPAPPVLTSVVKDDFRTGTLLCLNVTTSTLPALGTLAPGDVARVRVSVSEVSDDAPRALGEAPVFSDGSFFLEVPADRPLRLTLLGRDGRALAEQHSDIWVRPNENRGCIGCHEAPDLAPENRRPLAVSGAPTSIGGTSSESGGSDNE